MVTTSISKIRSHWDVIFGRSRGRSVFWTEGTNHQHSRCSLGNSEQHEENKTEPLSFGKWGCQRVSVGIGGKKINTSSTSPDMWLLSLFSLQKKVNRTKICMLVNSLPVQWWHVHFQCLLRNIIAILFSALKGKIKSKVSLILVR